MEARSLNDDERIATLEKQFAETQIIAEDADRRYDEVSFLFYLSDLACCDYNELLFKKKTK